MDEQETKAFSLEDILEEFSGTEPTAPEPPEPAAGDTIRMDVPVTGDTIRVEAAGAALGDTRRIDLPVEPDDAAPAEAPQEPESQEPAPFEPGWEPEYEEPIGDYTPPEPIRFQPRSHLRELKRKLVAGPEKRYYDLTELGLGRIQLALVLVAVVALLSGGSMVLYGLGMVPAGRMRLLVYGQVLALLLSALPGAYLLTEGMLDLSHKRFTLNTALFFTFLICLTDGILGLGSHKVPFCAPFCLEMAMALWAQYQRRNTELGQMDTMRRANRLDSLVKTDGLYEGQAGFQRGEGRVEDFMDSYAAPSGMEKMLARYTLAALTVSLVLGLAAGILHGFDFGVHTAAAGLLAAIPATTFVVLSRPNAVLEKRLHHLGAVLCGWKGVEGLCGLACVPLSDGDLFPGGSVKMNGVKFYGSRDPDQVVAYGTALIAAEGGGLTPVFEQLLDSRSGRHYNVEGLRNYGNGGLGGEVNGEPVLVGILPFLRDMGVDMPEGTRVNQAVYVAIDGELCGVFAITYGRVASSAAGLMTLCSYRRLTPVLTSRDFMLTESFLRSKFGINTRHMEFPDRETRFRLSEDLPDPETPALALTTQEGLAPMAFAITGARALRTAVRMGAVMHMAAGILGLFAVGFLGIQGSMELISPMNLLLYDLTWMIPGLLITEWTRSV